MISLISSLKMSRIPQSLAEFSKRSLSYSTCTTFLRSRNNFRFRVIRKISSPNPAQNMTENVNNIVYKRYDIITKGAQDNREYRGLELTNGLRVLLISDPTTDKSAAALDVNVGHLMDPWELPGLAHFCEHMLFLGTEKYPSENEYSKFLAAHAGSSNAYTASDHTNYHFDVKPDQLPGALDRFVQFFLGPQFTESATEREVCAVDSEHSNNLKNDSWRFMQVDRSRSKEGHDYGKFGTGNKKTLLEDARLKGIEPRDALLKFHKKWYSSNIMALCIIGKESLNELEGYLGTLDFHAIENKNVDRIRWDDGPYGPEQLGKRIEVVPIKDTRLLSIAFPFPDLTAEYSSQPHHYISHLLGHEGPGSMLSELKRLGWVSSLSSGYCKQANGFGVFDVSMDLSTEGIEHVEDIIDILFNYVGLLERSGPQKWVQDELSELSAIKFRFKDKETPINLVTSVASELQHIPFEDVLSSKYLIKKFDSERISELLGLLKPSNMVYRVVSQQFAGQEGNTHEPIYGTEIRVTDITENTLERFSSARNNDHDAFRLPEKNDYIASKFDLKQRESEDHNNPRVILDDGWCRVWFKQDNEYKMPKQETKLALTTPIVANDPKTSLISSLWLWCLSDSLAEETYNADLAGLKCQLDSGPFGVHLRVHGYDEKQPLFIKHIITRMTNFNIDKTRFDVLFESLRRALRNFSHSQPYSLSQHYAQLLLSDKTWSKDQLLAVCDGVSLNDVQGFAKAMLNAFHLEIFVHGNSTEQETLNLASDVIGILRNVSPYSRPLFWNEHAQRREISLNNGDEFVYRHLQSTHDVSCVEVMYQIGVQNTYDNAVVGLLEQIIKEPAFNTLRTKEALGYIVWAGTRLSSGTISMNVIVQGPKEVDHVLERIEAFLNSARQDLVEMSEEEFNKHIAGMIARLQEKPKTLSGRFRRFWSEIEARQYDFDRREKEIEVLNKLTKKEVLELFDKKIGCDAPERKKLAILVHGKDDSQEKVSEIVKNKSTTCKETELNYIEQLRETLPYHGRPKPQIDLKPIGVDPLEALNYTSNQKSKY